MKNINELSLEELLELVPKDVSEIQKKSYMISRYIDLSGPIDKIISELESYKDDDKYFDYYVDEGYERGEYCIMGYRYETDKEYLRRLKSYLKTEDTKKKQKIKTKEKSKEKLKKEVLKYIKKHGVPEE